MGAMNDCGILVEDYVCGPTSIVGAQDDLDGRLTKDARARLEAAIAEVVAVEAPIELDALTRKIGKRFGYQRVARRWKKKIAYRIPGGVLVDEGPRSFVWPEGSSPATWRGYRASEGARTIAEIPTTELANAIVAAVGNASEGLDHEGAYRGAMALFGLSRLTSLAAEYLEEALALAIIRGDLLDEGTRVTLAPAESAGIPAETSTETELAAEVAAEKATKTAATESVTDDAEMESVSTIPVAHEEPPIRTESGIVFKRWRLDPGMRISSLINNCRRGIYVLEFTDGSRYVGLSENVVTRFSTHVHGSAHHEGWNDVARFRFREMPEGDLREAEKLEIRRQQSRGVTLRNKDLNIGHSQPSPFDLVVSVEDQEHWATGHARYGLADVSERLGEAASDQSKISSHVPKSIPHEIYEGVLSDIEFCLSELIPDALELETRYWSVSDWPSTGSGRLACLNVGQLELAYFPRHRQTFILDDDREEIYTCNLNLHVSMFRDFDHDHAYKKSLIPRHVGLSRYSLTKTGHVEVPVGQLRQFFEDVPELLPYARRLVIELMRQKDVSMFRRYHSRALAREVFEYNQARLASS